MAGTTLKRESLADQAAAAILQMIFDDGLTAGDYLPSTNELAERFGVSRTVVREALADLAGRGIIARSQGRESVVAAPGPQQLQELLSFHVGRQNIDMVSLMEFRQPIEVAAASLAAVRATPEDRERIQAALQRQSATLPEAEFHEADYAFHREIAVASHNPLFVLVFDAVGELLRIGRQRSYKGRKRRGNSIEEAVAEHQAILAAILDGSPDEAAAAMTAHLNQTMKDLTAS